jgi:iron(III) transport system ATP-binding protein
MSNHAPLKAAGLTKRYGDRDVVSDVNLDLNPGEITALVGMSGAGKTTLLRLYAGMERPSHGRVLSGETELSSPANLVPIEKRRIGLVFQDFALFPHLDVLKNIAFGLQHLPKEDRVKHAKRWTERLELSHREDAYPHHLSGGEQQRVAIARALAPAPVAILLDEPFSGLDPSMREHVRHVALSAIREANVPSLLVTHDASEALVHADKVAIIHEGQILQCDRPDVAYTQPNCLESARALGPIHTLAKSHLPEEWQTKTPDSETLHYRPEALRIDPNSKISLKLTRWRLAGALTEMTFQYGNSELFMSARPNRKLNIGDEVPVDLDPSLVFNFPDEQSDISVI